LVRARVRHGLGRVIDVIPRDIAVLVGVKLVIIFNANPCIARYKHVFVARSTLAAPFEDEVKYFDGSLVCETVDERFCCLLHSPSTYTPNATTRREQEDERA